jgi:outer membrane protein TolC
MIAKLEYEKANINLRSLQNTISIEVKETVRNIEMSLKRLDATRASRILSKERLNAIQKKFENGMATNFEVSEYQQALAAAESEEISALIEYNVALLSLEKVKGNLLQSRGIILEKTQPEI